MQNQPAHVEHAPLLLVFGPLAERTRRLVHLRPDLLPRIVLAPRRALHGLASFLYFAPEAALPDEEVAQIIAERHPRNLLRAAFPNAPARLYKTLEKCGDGVQQKFFYFRLAALSVSPVADDVFACPQITEQRIAAFEKWLDRDPAVLACRKALGGSGLRADALQAVMQFARAHHVLKSDDLTVPDGAGLHAVVTRVLNILDRIQVPAPFTLAPPFRVITSLGELRKAGAELGNCLREPHRLWFSFAEGAMTFVVSHTPPLMAALRPVGPQLWRIDPVDRLNDELKEDAAMARLIDALHRAGVQLSDMSTADAVLVLYNDLLRSDEGDPEEEVDEHLLHRVARRLR